MFCLYSSENKTENMISEKHAEYGGFIDKQNKWKIHLRECQRKISAGKNFGSTFAWNIW